MTIAPCIYEPDNFTSMLDMEDVPENLGDLPTRESSRRAFLSSTGCMWYSLRERTAHKNYRKWADKPKTTK